jgi:hypothetical protein
MKPSWFEIPAPETDLILLENELRQKETHSGETSVTTIPLHKMWKPDMLWISHIISGQKFIAKVDLEDESSGDSSNAPFFPLVKWWIASVDESNT